jgi:predicted enzyme related to lactoylglutathione lyase
MGHRIVHWELMGADGAAQKAFYSQIFGWNLEGVEGFGHYYMVSNEEAGVGGAVGQGNEHMPNYQAMYVEVPDIDAHLAKIEAAGGKTAVPRTVVPDTVVFALFSDPAGNLVGLVEEEMPS